MTSCASPPTRAPGKAPPSACAERLVVRRAVVGRTRSSATYSACGRYRYRLSRLWGEGATVLWIMLNPSTASEVANDPTIARCEKRSRAMGFGGLTVVNLFAFRATRPSDLWQADDPIGPDTDRILMASVARAGLILCAWGIHGGRMGRDAAVLGHLGRRPLACLGTTQDGHPRHPLYVGGVADVGGDPASWGIEAYRPGIVSRISPASGQVRIASTASSAVST